MSAEITAAAISAAAALAAGGVQSGVNGSMNAKTRKLASKQFKEQMAFAREQWDWQKYAAENAYQIATSDAESAGLSPLAVLDSGVGSATSAGGVSQPSVPDAMFNTPDINSVMDSIRVASSALSGAFEEQGRNRRNDADNSAKLEQIQKQYEAEALLLSQKGEQEAARLADTLAASSWSSDSSQQHEINMSVINSFKDFCGYVPPYKYYDNEADYNTARVLMNTKLQTIFEEYSQMVDVSSDSASSASSSSDSSAANAGLSAGVGSVGSGGFNYGAQHSESGSDSASASHFQNKTRNNQAWLSKEIQKAGIVLPLMRTSSPYQK